jgi:hypothetical protein
MIGQGFSVALPTASSSNTRSPSQGSGSVGTFATSNAVSSVQLQNGITCTFYFNSNNVLYYTYGPDRSGHYHSLQVTDNEIKTQYKYTLTATLVGDEVRYLLISLFFI